MEIILKQDVANLGHKDDIVTVKNGYAANYLIPQGYAIMATPSAKKVHAENLRQRAHKEAKIREEATALAALGHEIDRRNITLVEADKVQEVGTFAAVVKCYKEIKANINVEVVGEE